VLTTNNSTDVLTVGQIVITIRGKIYNYHWNSGKSRWDLDGPVPGSLSCFAGSTNAIPTGQQNGEWFSEPYAESEYEVY
jgi:hypothetical protein